MTSPDEEVRKKSAEAKAKEPEKPSASPGDPLSFVGQLLGDAKNLAVDAASGTHSGDKVLSAITPQLAAQYQRGKDVQERIASGAVKQNQLSESDRKNLDAYNNVRKNIAQVPLYDRDSLTRYVEKGIAQKAKTAPPDVPSRVSKDAPTRPAVSKPAEQIVRESGPAKKGTVHPGQADKPIHPAPTDKSRPGHPAQPVARKDVAAPAGDTRNAITKPTQPAHVPERIVPESRTGVNRTPTDQNASSSTRDVKGDQPRTPSSLPANRDVRPNEERTATADTKTRGTDSDLQTNSAQRENRSERELPVPPANHSQFSERQRASETDLKPAIRATHDARPQSLDTPRTESFVGKKSDTGSNAIIAFERRTGYDARDQQSDKQNSIGKSIETNNQTQARAVGRVEEQEEKPKGAVESQLRHVAHQDVPSARSDSESAGATQYRRCFENMRRVLDERTYIANNLVQRPVSAEQLQVKPSAKLQENAETREIPRHLPGSERRISLAEIKNSLPEQRVQQIVRISDERFPAGLRWQNTVRQPDAAPPAGRTRQPETPGITPAVKPTDRSAGNTPTRPGNPDEIPQNAIGQNPLGTAKNLSFNGRVNDRYITGAEIALAAIIAAAGAKRIRFDETRPGSELGTQIPRVQKIQAFLPNTSAAEKGTARTDGPKLDTRRADVAAAADRTVSTAWQKAMPQETFTSTFKPSEKRFLTGVEVALAAVIASCGTARIRQNLSNQPMEDEPLDNNELADEKDLNVEESKKQELKKKESKKQESNEEDSPDDDVPGTLRYLQTHRYNRRTIMIGPGDTFVSISENEFHQHRGGNLGWLIADINLPRIKETYIDGKRIVEVRSRQSIELPAADDIAAFIKHRKKEHTAENLITIVLETQIDRELLNEHLGVFVDAGGKSTGPAVTSAAASSMYGRTTVGADGSGILPSLALESGNILKVASERLIKLSRAALDKGRKPFSKIRESLRRDKIKRRF